MPHYDIRATIYLSDPRTLTVKWEDNISRGGTRPPVDDSIIALAKSMLPKDTDPEGSSGQLQPIVCHTAKGGDNPRVALGYRRYAAALWLVESGTCPEFKIKYTTSRMSPEDAALANLDENIQRSELEPIQIGKAVRRLTEDMGMPIAAVAQRLKRSEGHLKQLLNMLTLPAEIQSSIANGETTVTAGIQFARLPDADQVSVFREALATAPDGTVKVAAVKKLARKKAEAKPAAAGKPAAANARTAKAIKRSLKDLESFLEDRASIGEPDAGKLLANAILDFIDGKATQAATEEVWANATR